MRHFVNFGLLFAFTVLAASGSLLFLRPFSLVVARVHILLAIATVGLVGLHLVSKAPYFRAKLRSGDGWGLPNVALGALAVVSAVLVAAVLGWRPVEWLVDQGYESRARAEIVRPSSLSGFEWGGDASFTVARAPGENADLRVSLLIKMSQTSTPPPTIAVWAETTAGSMIETLYVDPRVAYTEEPTWSGAPIAREAILPIWRNRYTLVSGVAPGGDTDAVSGATPTHSFSLDDYLVSSGEDAIVLCVEINAPRDPNEAYPESLVGQPSLLYTAYVETDTQQPYALAELTGRGGGPGDGAIYYDLDGVTSAKRLVDLILGKIERVEATSDRPGVEQAGRP